MLSSLFSKFEYVFNSKAGLSPCKNVMYKHFSPLFALVSGGRSRLHLIDLGSCEKVLSKSRDGGGSLCLSLSALGNVILALINGAKHVPYK